jgi:lipopolysaccharide transport protein LptA
MIGQLCALVAAAAPAQVPQGPVSYSAETMTMDPKDRRVLLESDVHLERGDLVVTGDRATAYLADPQAQPPAPAGRLSHKAAKPKPEVSGLSAAQLRRFAVEGHVHVVQRSRTADGARAEYDAEAQTMLLTGRNDAVAAGELAPGPVLRDGAESLTGDRVLLHLDSDDVEVDRPRLVLRRSAEAAQPGPSAAREGASKPVVPVRVEAKRLRLDSGRRIAHFSDDVVVHRGEMTVRGPLMDARYDKGGDLTELSLNGGVELRQGDRRATGKTAVYDAATHKVVLTGDPRLYDRGDRLEGARIEMALDSREVKVDRARGRLHPEAHEREEGVR